MKKKLSVDMHCASCALSIQKVLNKRDVKVSANAALKIVKVEFDETKISLNEIKHEISKIGYNAKEL